MLEKYYRSFLVFVITAAILYIIAAALFGYAISVSDTTTAGRLELITGRAAWFISYHVLNLPGRIIHGYGLLPENIDEGFISIIIYAFILSVVYAIASSKNNS